MSIKSLAIVGTGIMGIGIAQIAAQAGIEVRLFDSKAGAALHGLQTLTRTLTTLKTKGKIDDGQFQATLANLSIVETIQQIQGVDLVIEAIIEDLTIKQQLFIQLETIVGQHTILASNTSSLSITAIAAICQNPERVIGFHFFNPVPLMRIVEIIPGLSTQPAVTESLVILAKRLGHLGVVTKDTPGFIVNHAGRAYGTEALKTLGEGVASIETIDSILRDGVGFRMGPFELMDLTGLDVSHPVMESIYNQYYQEDRYRPHPLTRQMLTGKKLGRKVGEGFYRYEDGEKIIPVSNEPSNKVDNETKLAAPAFPAVWIGADLANDRQILVDYLQQNNVVLDKAKVPQPNNLIILATYGEDTTTAALRYQVNPAQSIAIDMLTGFDKLRTLMPSLVTPKDLIQQAQAIFAKSSSDGDGAVKVAVINESFGFVSQRVLALIVNLACDMAAQQIATAQDIDNAVRLGLGYPYGPITWGDKLGTAKILLILERISALSGDQRYRPTPWLQRRAKLGLSLLHTQNNLDFI